MKGGMTGVKTSGKSPQYVFETCAILTGCSKRIPDKIPDLKPNVRVRLEKEDIPDIFIQGPEDVADLVAKIQERDREVIMSVMLDRTHKVTGIETVSIGTLDSAIVTPREILKSAILQNSAAIVMVHNHPSGSTKFSPDDVRLSKAIKEASSIVGIKFLDSLIIGDGKFSSLSSTGRI